MKLREIANQINSQVILDGSLDRQEVIRVYAGDRISDLLNQSSSSTLIVTNAISAQLLRVADLMDLPAICLLNGSRPEPELLQLAKQNGIWLISSPYSMYETCGRLYACLPQLGGSR